MREELLLKEQLLKELHDRRAGSPHGDGNAKEMEDGNVKETFTDDRGQSHTRAEREDTDDATGGSKECSVGGAGSSSVMREEDEAMNEGGDEEDAREQRKEEDEAEEAGRVDVAGEEGALEGVAGDEGGVEGVAGAEGGVEDETCRSLKRSPASATVSEKSRGTKKMKAIGTTPYITVSV